MTEPRTYECPLPKCDWTHQVLETPGSVDVLSAIFGLAPGAVEAQLQHDALLAAERAAQAHLLTHQPVEWLEPLVRAQRQRDALMAAGSELMAWADALPVAYQAAQMELFRAVLVRVTIDGP